MTINYPFTALVGQKQMKEALLLNLINPQIGGVLIRGEKGTAKSTAVRSLVDLLQEGQKVVNLPVSATEDRVVGTLDIEHALKTGEKKFEPGLLAEAHNNILYVDEVNLLEDHIVDLLLDAAAMGVNVVEREGISYTHPSRFILVGTMNPEEGDLRPQLLDRFGLVVEVHSEKDPEARMNIIKWRLLFEESPHLLREQFHHELKQLKITIKSAKDLVHSVIISDEIIYLAAQIGISCEVDGHRADITLIKAAMAMAALKGRNEVLREDIENCSAFVLSHRMKR